MTQAPIHFEDWYISLDDIDDNDSGNCVPLKDQAALVNTIGNSRSDELETALAVPTFSPDNVGPNVTLTYGTPTSSGVSSPAPFLVAARHGAVQIPARPGASQSAGETSERDDLSSRTRTGELHPLDAPDYETALAIYEWEYGV